MLVPLGVGAGAIGTLFLTHRALVIGIASGILVVFGLLQIFGIGFDPARLLPGGQALQQRASSSVGVIKTFLLGSASGIAGFCAGPILGAVLTLAAAQGDLFTAGALLAVYGAGMVVPLLIIAALWGKIGDQGRRRLRGRSFTVLGREFHTTSVITGVLITIVGVVFWATNGLIDMPSLIPTSVSAWVQGRSSILANGWVDLGVILAVAAIALLVWWRSARQKPVSAEPGEHETR